MKTNAFVENVKKKLKPRSKKQSTKEVKPTIVKQKTRTIVTEKAKQRKPTIAKQSIKKDVKLAIAKQSLEKDVKPTSQNPEKDVKPTSQNPEKDVKPTSQNPEKDVKPTSQNPEKDVKPTSQNPEKDVKPTSQNPEKKASKNKAKLQKKAIPGTVYLGHIPHGFYEQELQKYFSQFGKITQLRLCRSPKSGGSKGYAFIQFKFEEVAKIVAESMNNYLFFEKILKCHFIPPNKVHPSLFKGWKKGLPLSCDKNREIYNEQRTAKQIKKIANRRVKRLKELKEKLVAQGITDFKVKSFTKEKEELMKKL